MTTTDMSHIGEVHSKEGWQELMKAMDEARAPDKLLKIDESVFWYFLEVLPPRWMSGGQFVFAEGADDPTLFTASYGEHFCQRFSDYKKLSELLGTKRMLQRHE